MALSCNNKTVSIINSGTNINFYCLNCLNSFRTKINANHMKKTCKNKNEIFELLMKKIKYYFLLFKT